MLQFRRLTIDPNDHTLSSRLSRLVAACRAAFRTLALALADKPE